MLQEGRSKLTEGEVLISVLGGTGSVAPRVGADLRQARERIGYSQEEVADILRIRLSYLQALEDGRIADLPGTAYALGYLRTYAEALGLDVEEISRRFKSEADEVNKRIELDFPAPSPRGAIPAGAMALLGAVLVLGAYAGWYRLSGEGRLPAETVAPVPERLAPLAEQASAQAGLVRLAAPLPGAPIQVAPAKPTIADTVIGLPESRSISPGQAAAAIPLPPPEPPPPAVGLAAVAPPADAEPAASRVMVRAKAQVWIQLRERGGRVIVNRVLQPGETYAVPNRPDLLFTTGNALGTELLVDGVETPGLGGAKGVRRDLALDADMIKDGRLAAQLGGASTVTQTQ